jgi:hypothetical protein
MARLIAFILVLTFLAGAGARADDRPQEFVYPAAIEVSPVTQEKWDRSSPESAYLGIRAANLADDAEWILAGFAPQDREKIVSYLSNAEMRAANVKAQRAIVSETIKSAVTYKSHVILIVVAQEAGGFSYSKPIPMIETAEGWALTNALRDDPVFGKLMEGKLK